MVKSGHAVSPLFGANFLTYQFQKGDIQKTPNYLILCLISSRLLMSPKEVTRISASGPCGGAIAGKLSIPEDLLEVIK